MNEFKINEFLTLKLEAGKTNIYVNGEFFDIIISNDDITEDEFQEICSDFKKWYEHEYKYQTYLHSNYTSRLLSKLTQSGDPIATKTYLYKENIKRRIKSSDPPSIFSLMEAGDLRGFNIGELGQLVKNFPDTELKIYENRFGVEGMRNFLNQNFKGFVKALDHIERHYHNWSNEYTWIYEEDILGELQRKHLNFFLKMIFKYLDDSTILAFLMDLARTFIFNRIYTPHYYTYEDRDDDEDWAQYYDQMVFPTLISDPNMSRIIDLILRCVKSEDTELLDTTQKFLDHYHYIIFEPLLNRSEVEENKEELFLAFSMLLNTSPFLVEIMFGLASGSIGWIFGSDKRYPYDCNHAPSMYKLNDFLPKKSETEKYSRFKKSILKLFLTKDDTHSIFYLDFNPFLGKEDLKTLASNTKFIEYLPLLIEGKKDSAWRVKDSAEWNFFNNFLCFLNRLFAELGDEFIAQILKIMPLDTIFNMCTSLVKMLNILYNGKSYKDKNLDLINTTFKNIETLANSINKSVSYEDVTKYYENTIRFKFT